MNEEAVRWLAARRPAPPPALAAALRTYLADAPADGPLPAVLAEAGVAALERALALGDERAAAYPLLAADALFTYAIEAAAEQGSETLAALLDTWGPARLGRLIGPEP